MTDIEISESIRSLVPDLRLGCIACEVKISTDNPELWKEIDAGCAELQAKLETPDIAQRPTIQATRLAYKATGKDPSRYRPSAEALTRRVVKGKGLYQVNNVVDLLNLVSITSGFSIGGWDADQIKGKAVLGIGKEGEPYEAIGRGELNIAGLTLFRDDQGAFGTPTSDSERTRVQATTSRFLMVFYDFSSDPSLNKSMDQAVDLLIRFGGAGEVQQWIVP